MGGITSSPWKAGKKHKKKSEKDWEELGRKVEKKVMREMKSWAEEPEQEESGGSEDGGEPNQAAKSDREKEWEEIGHKVEEKIKRKVKKWAEEE